MRLFTIWVKAGEQAEQQAVEFERVWIPEISLNDMFDDAFNAISRDGAPMLEVAIRLQKAFHSLASLGDDQLKTAAIAHAQFALCHAEQALDLHEELSAVRNAARWIHFPGREQPAPSDAG